MAYRPVVEGDKVKVKNLSKDNVNHGFRNMFGEAYRVEGGHVSVAFGTTGKVFRQDELMIASNDLSGSIYRFRNTEWAHEKLEPDDNSEFEDWDIDDYICRIRQLERQLEEMEK